MTVSHKNRVQMSVSGTPGTGTITLGSAASGYQSFSAAHGANATVDCLIEDGTAWEIARGCTYTHSGTTLSRGTLEASSTGSAISLTSAAVVSQIFTADAGRRWDAAALSDVAGTDADTTMVCNTLYVVDMAAWATANRTYTLPTTAAVGDRVGVMIKGGNATYALLLTAAASDTLNGIAGGTEWSRLFISNELVIMRCVTANSAWVVDHDGRIPQQVLMRLSTSTTGNEAVSTWTSPTSISGAWTADIDNASLASTSNNRFAVRRAGNYSLSAGARAVNAQADGELFGVVLWKNGTSTLIGTNQGRTGATTSFWYATWAIPLTPLAAGDTVNYQFQSSAGSRNLFASGYNSYFAGLEVLSP